MVSTKNPIIREAMEIMVRWKLPLIGGFIEPFQNPVTHRYVHVPESIFAINAGTDTVSKSRQLHETLYFISCLDMIQLS